MESPDLRHWPLHNVCSAQLSFSLDCLQTQNPYVPSHGIYSIILRYFRSYWNPAYSVARYDAGVRSDCYTLNSVRPVDLLPLHSDHHSLLTDLSGNQLHWCSDLPETEKQTGWSRSRHRWSAGTSASYGSDWCVSAPDVPHLVLAIHPLAFDYRISTQYSWSQDI